MGLITLQYAQQRLPGVPADALTALIEAASARFEAECGRTFAAGDYRESARGPVAVLAQYPAIRVDRVGADPTDALRIANPGAVRAGASVVSTSQVSEAPLKLRLIAFAAGATTTDEVTIADYPTLSALAGAVAGVGNGWIASVEGDRGDHPSDDLLIGVYAAAGSGCVLRADSRSLGADFATPEDREASIVRIGGCFGRVRVWYRAGYEEIPADIREAVVAMIAASQDPNQAGGGGVKRHKHRDYEVEYFGATEASAFPKSARSAISTYRDRRI